MQRPSCCGRGTECSLSALQALGFRRGPHAPSEVFEQIGRQKRDSAADLGSPWCDISNILRLLRCLRCALGQNAPRQVAQEEQPLLADARTRFLEVPQLPSSPC